MTDVVATQRGWRRVVARRRGTSHARTGTECQDFGVAAQLASSARESPLLVAIVSDGAGSARHSARGSELACEGLLDAVEAWTRRTAADGGPEDEPTADGLREAAVGWVRFAKLAVEAAALAAENSARQYACTLLALVAASTWRVCLQIGDGAIVVGDEQGYELAFWPDNGEYLNETRFLTEDDALDRLQLDVRLAPNGGVRRAALFSDGLQRLVIDEAARAPHVRSFEPMFAAMERHPVAKLGEFADELTMFLGDVAVTSRSDDDVTLILVSREGEA